MGGRLGRAPPDAEGVERIVTRMILAFAVLAAMACTTRTGHYFVSDVKAIPKK